VLWRAGRRVGVHKTEENHPRDLLRFGVGRERGIKRGWLDAEVQIQFARDRLRGAATGSEHEDACQQADDGKSRSGNWDRRYIGKNYNAKMEKTETRLV